MKGNLVTSPRRFKIPRKEVRPTEDCQFTLPVNSREAKDIGHAVKRQTWDSNDLVRDISNVQIKKVDNRCLERGYHEKRSALREKGRTPKELTEQLAFTVETDEYRVNAICRDGLKCTGIDHTLGDGGMGVTVWRCPDLCLKGLNWPASESAFLLVFKIVKGRVKSVPCKPSPGIPNLEPTPNHDCHMARNTLDSSATDLNLLLRITQYYLYEYDDEGLPVKRPRQCLPFAVISLNKNDLPRVPSPARPLMFTPLTSGRHFKEHAEDLRSPPCNETGGILVWRGLVTSRNKSLGRVSLFSGHRLGFNIWKSYLDVSKKMPLRQLTELLPRDLKCAWKSPLLYRNHTLSICTMKVAQDEPTETLTSFNRRLVTKAKSAGVLYIDKTTTMLIISSKLAKFLGLCDSDMPAEIFCIVCRRKTTPFFSSSYSNNLPSQQCNTCGLLDGSTAFIQSSLHLNSRHSAKIVVSLPETSLLPSSQYRSPRKGVKRSLSFSHIPCRGVDASNSGGRTYRSASCCEKRSSKRETSPAEVFINEKILRNSDPGVDKADALVIENRSINEPIPSCSDSTLSVEAFQAPNSNWAANDNTIENLKRFVCNTVNFKEPLSDLRSGDFSKLESEIQTTQSSQATKLEATCIPLADFRDTEIRHLQEPHLGTLNLQQRQTFKSAKLESMYNPLGDFQDVNTISSSNSMSERKESCETQMESSVKLPTTEHAGQQTNSTGDDLPLSSAILGQDITLPLTPISVPTEVKYSHLTSGKSSTPSIDYERSCGKCSLNSIDEKYSRNYENENEKVTMKHSSALSTSAMYGVTAIQASVTLHSAQDKSKDSSCATDTITFSSSDKEQFDNSVLVSSQSQSSSGNKAMISIQPTSPFNAQDMSSSETVESKREIENYIPSLPTATDVERDVAACEQLNADVLPSFSLMYSMKSHKVCIDRLRLLQDALKAPRKGSGFDANSKARNPRPVRDSLCKEDSPSSVKTKEDPFGLNLESTEGTSAKESMADSSKNTLHTSQTSSQRHIVLDKQSWPCQGGAIEMSLNKDWGFSANVDDHRAKHELKSCEDSLCCSDGLASTDGDEPAEKLSLPMGIETKAVECGPQDQLKAHTVRKRVKSCDNAEDVGGRKGIEPDGKGGGSCGLVEEQGRDFISKMEPCSRLSSNAKLSSDRFECEASSQGECCTNEMAEIEPETTESIAVEPKRVLSQTVKVKEEVSPVKVLLHEIKLKRDDFEALNNRKRPANASSSFMESLLSNKTKVDTHQEKQLMADVAVVVGKHSEMNQKKNQRRLENEGELFKRRRNATIYQSRRRAESLSLPPRAPPPPLAYFNTGWKRGREVLVNDTRGIGLRRYHSDNVRFNNQFPIPYVDNAMNWELLRTGGNQRCYPYCNDLLPLHNRRMNHLWHCLMLDGLRWLPWR